MTLFGKSLGEYVFFVRTGMILILLMGLARFIVGASGVPYDRATHLASMTILTMLLYVFYGHRVAALAFGGYRHLLPLVVLLLLTMYGFIVLAILVQGSTGIHGYFHSPGSGLAPPGMDVATHIGGQFIAMLIGITPAWLLASLGFVLSRYLGALRKAFLLMALMALLRLLLGGLGVPYAIGTWISSLTLLAMLLSFYHGYRAPSMGFTGYRHALLIGIVIGATLQLLVIYGIMLTTSLEIPNYFHAPGEGFQPLEWSVGQHIAGHLQSSVIAMIIMGVLAALGFGFGKRRTALATA